MREVVATRARRVRVRKRTRRTFVAALGALLLVASAAPLAGAGVRRGGDRALDAARAGDAGAPPAPARTRPGRKHQQMVLAGGGTGVGETRVYEDQVGTTVYRVDSGFDLDQYLFANSSPLDFSIDVDRSFGPVDSLGRPAPGNSLYGKTGRITLRVFDVDDDNVSTGFVRELDKLVVNGTVLPGFLSGADNQWSINSFELPLNLLRLPTATNPQGRNHFQVLIDTGNGGQLVWAVQVDWAEIRLADQVLPLAMVHGITGSGGSMAEMREFYELNAPELQGRIVNPSVTKNGSIAENAALLEEPIENLLRNTGSYNVNILAHSMGGLNSRLYAWDHPSQVKQLMMVATPNGGSRLADVLCGNRNIPWYLRGLVNEALDYFTRQFGDCTGPEDGLYQLQQSYVQDVFNEQVLDRHGTRYWTIAGQGNAALNLLLDGEDDGAVSVASVRYLRPDLPADPNPDHPGMHTALYPAYEKDHSGLIKSGSPALPRSLCTLYPALYSCPSSSLRTLSAVATGPPPLSFEMSSSASAVVAPGATTHIPMSFEGAPRASVLVLSDHAEAIEVAHETTAFEPTEVFGEPALAAALTNPADTPLTVTNGGGDSATVIVLTGVETARHMTVSATPPFAGQGDPVTVAVSLTDASADDVPKVRITDETGAVVAAPEPAQVGPGEWETEVVPAAGGLYSVAAWVEGSRSRFALDTFSVSSGAASLTGGFTASLVDAMGDGLADELVIRPGLSVAEAGEYRVSARLLDSTGAQVATAGASGSLGAGSTTLPLRFDGRDIFRSGRSGPYTVADVTLSRADTMAIEDVAASLGQTAAYDYRIFEHFRITIDPSTFDDRGIDTNGDGQFETLEITGGVRVDSGGTYAVNGRLLAPDGTELGEFQTVRSLQAGNNQLTLTFSGNAIGASGLDGPYTLADLSVYSLSSTDVLGYLVAAHTTGPYTSGQFQGGVAPPPPPEDATFDALRALLVGLRDAGSVGQNAYQSLVAKLDAAEAAYGRGDTRPAVNVLEAFLNELDAQRGKKIAEDAYVKLHEAATRLQERL